MGKIRAGLVGFGYWGPNLYRNILQSPDFQLTAIIDSDVKKLEKVKSEKPGLLIKTAIDDQIIEQVDAFFIATPASTHFDLANDLLDRKKHVWIEKPVCSSFNEIQNLSIKAEKNKVVAVADHTYTFAPSVVYLRELIRSGEIGEILYIHSVRSNLGIFQPDVSVIWDLAVHDLSILSHIIPCSDWESISCSAGNPLQGPTESIADITLKTKEKQYLSIHVNWLSPIKIRQMVIGGTKASVIFDDLEMFEKLKITKQTFQVSSENDRNIAAVSYSLGDSVMPRLNSEEPLASGIEHFAGSILTGASNSNSLINIVEIYRALERAQESSKLGGREILL